jgi:hypothetical protein
MMRRSRARHVAGRHGLCAATWLLVGEADPMLQPLVCPDESGPRRPPTRCRARRTRPARVSGAEDEHPVGVTSLRMVSTNRSTRPARQCRMTLINT